MKLFKKAFAVVLCIALFASIAVTGTTVFAAAPPESIEGLRWFPVPAEWENDDLWEVECFQEGCLCQRFDDDPAETGYESFLDTTYGDNGSLTITRNGKDNNDMYWPRIRTLNWESNTELDIKVANTFYYDFVVAEGSSCNLLIAFNGMNMKLSKAIADQSGVALNSSDEDLPAGTYKGSIDLQATIETIAQESGTESAMAAQGLKNIKKTYIPQLSIFCVGGVGASVTINEMFISTADDATGAKCTFANMGLLAGDDYYEIADEPAEDTDADVDVDTDPTEEEGDDETTETTKKADDKKDDKKDDEGGFPIWIIAVAAGAVVVVAAVVVVVVKKKNA